LVELAWVRLNTHRERTYEIGGKRITLPRGHRLDWFRTIHPRYNEPVALICGLARQKYGRLLSIDVGANVGGTAALAAQDSNFSILCVEGNPFYFSFLQRNVAKFCPTAEFEKCFVGATDGELHGEVKRTVGTASIIVGSPGARGTIELVSFDSLLARHPRFSEARFLKIDTDGFDPNILLSAMRFLSDQHPLVYFEMDPCQAQSPRETWRRILDGLQQIGYDRFNVFDNFGAHLVQLGSDQIGLFDQLFDYVLANRGLEKPAIYYFDVCAISAKDHDISDAIRSAAASPSFGTRP